MIAKVAFAVALVLSGVLTDVSARRSSTIMMKGGAMRRRLQAGVDIGDTYTEICAPAIGDSSEIFVIVGGIANVTQYRGVLLISPDGGNSWWDKTCGINGHPFCMDADGVPGFASISEEGGGLFSIFPWVTNAGDENATDVAFFVVPVGQVNSVADPNGRGIPQSLIDMSVMWAQVKRSATENSCFSDATGTITNPGGAAPSFSSVPEVVEAQPSPPIDDTTAAGTGDAATSPLPIGVTPSPRAGGVSTVIPQTTKSSDVQVANGGSSPFLFSSFSALLGVVVAAYFLFL